jgi:hypothetical protein
LESSQHGIYKKIHGPKKLKRNMRKNMKIPRKKEQDYQPDMNSPKAVKQKK